MDTRIYNIDSRTRNKATFESNTFRYNLVEGARVDPFNIKNVIDIKVLSMELPNITYNINAARGNNTFTFAQNIKQVPDGTYTKASLIARLNLITDATTFTLTNGIVTMAATNLNTIIFAENTVSADPLGTILGFPLQTFNSENPTVATNAMLNPNYFFLRLNDMGNIINRNINYVAKIVEDTSVKNTESDIFYKIITNRIKFDQPIDIPNLTVSLEDELGNLVNLNGLDFAFTLEVTIVTNTILKNFGQIRFYNDTVMHRILSAKMLAYYEKQDTSNSMAGRYIDNLVNLNNAEEYTFNGNSNSFNQAPSFSYFDKL